MNRSIFVSEGLSQEARKFKELAQGFVAINDMTLQQLLEKICEYEQERESTPIINKEDIPLLANAIEFESDGNTEPSKALYVVVAKLLGRIQERLNQLPDRRIDFYFHKVLGQKPNEAHGDHAHVVIPVESSGFRHKLLKGARFIAGTNENGEPIEYKSVNDVELNDIQVQKIYTLAVPENGIPTVTDIPVYTPEQALESKDPTPYPLFGLTRSGDRSAASQNARIGLAVSSRLLYLNDGIRRIKVKIFFDTESVKGTLLEKGQSPEQFIKFFENAFRISLSTAEGWYDVEGYQLDSNLLDSRTEQNCIGLTIQLSEMVPPIVNCDPAIHGAEFDMQGPAMKIIVMPRTSYNSWNTLRKLKLRKISLQAKVTGSRRLALSNDIGPLATSAPVQPFGPLPAVGNSFIVGCEEIRGKRLSAFSIHGNWRGLPNVRDFCDWYRLYPEAPLTRDFKVGVSALLGGTWYPFSSQAAIEQKLFQIEPDKISDQFYLSCDDVLGGCSASQTYDAENFEYTPSARDGFFKIKLISPEKGFMHQEYSKVLCGNLMQQAIKKNFGQDFNLPQQPYTPELENLSIDYTATAEINLRHSDNSDGDFIYLRPWGVSKRSQLQLEGGALLLGLANAKAAKSVNLYFVLNRDSDYIYNNEDCTYTWSYLGANGWTKLPADNILYNTTAHFTTSGIVSLTLPKDFQTDSPLMPEGLCWLRLETQKCWRHCSRLFAVYAQGIEIVRCSGFGTKESFKHCKPGTINELAQSISGFSQVFQLEESFGGEPEENQSEMRTRVAEYLYHRDRALTAKDCEKLILEQFPEVHLVKCFACLDPEKPDVPTPGQILVVPVSSLFDDGRRVWDPCLSGKTLEDIKIFLSQRTSSFSKISVMNPLFEKIQIRCNVDFINGIDEGERLLDLNKVINRFLSPWSNSLPEHFFGWSLNKQHLLSLIESLPYVKAVSDFTVLRICSKDNCNYNMEESDEKNIGYIQGTYPWSILTPMKRHFINVVAEIEESRDITVGFGDLEIGSTFIIQRRNNG